MKVSFVFGLFGCLASFGCASRTTCAGVGLIRVTPMEATLRVGESITLHLQEGESPCGDRDENWRDVPARWRTNDTLVVRVDSLLGRVSALRAGDARVAAGQGDALSALVHVR